MKRKLEQSETQDEAQSLKRQKVDRKETSASKESRMGKIKQKLIESFGIKPEKIKILGLGDCLFVQDVHQDDNFTKTMMEGLMKEFRYLDPSDPRAARNRAGQPLSRTKACLRKHKVDKKGRVWKCRYGNYAGAVPMHKFASSQMTQRKTPFAHALFKFSDFLCDQVHSHAISTIYKDENDGISAHSDKTQDMELNSLIVSWSFGESREFLFEPIDKNGPYKKFSVILKNGSFFVMGPETNRHYTHSIPKQDQPCKLRMSVILRCIDTYVLKDY